MPFHFRTSAIAMLVVGLAWVGAACDSGDEEGDISSGDAAVLTPDAGAPTAGGLTTPGGTGGLPGGTTAGGVTAGGATPGGATPGGATPGGATPGGATPGGAGGSQDAGGGVPGGGVRDAGVDAGGTRDAGPADATVPVGDGGGGQFEAVRQVCVDTINMYRATRNLPPLTRAPAAAEACADEGAKYDGDLNRGRPANQVEGHASTRNRSAMCKTVGFGAQNACPNYPVGRSGYATVADSLKRCLAQMWAEGEPPVPIADCIKDQTPGGCFLSHGHWINMVSTTSTWVACGFYEVSSTAVWMNQDFNFGRR
ncbi:MAG TPA: CAP domain-containing protein [Polyangiales bacterium]